MIEFGYVKERDVPDIPIIYLRLRLKDNRVGGPAIIDTGFDGGVYPNALLYDLLKGTEDSESVVLEDVSGEIRCGVVTGEAEVFHSDSEARLSLGNVMIYLPENENYLTENVIVGREVLNSLDIRLDGKTVRIY